MNKVILVGNLGSDPELRNTQSGTSVCNMSIATNRQWTDDSGETQQDTEWHRIVVFGAQAESCAEYLESGRQVLVEGRLQTREWEDNDGNTNYTTEVVANNVQFLSGGEQQGSDSGPSPEGDGDESDSYDDDEIPF